MTRAPVILRPESLPVKDRGHGARTAQMVGPRCGARGLLNGITAFDPGAAIGLHFHNCEESVLVIEGDAVFECDGVRHRLGPGDTTFVPAGLPHRFLNESDAPMRIFWTYADIDATRTLVDTGATGRVDAEAPEGPPEPG